MARKDGSFEMYGSTKGDSLRIVCGLDFGTYGTGVAFRLANSNEPPKYNTSWPGLAYPRYCKTLTAILYKHGKPYEWGWEARHKYSELDDKRRGVYQYIDQFKLALDGNSSYALPEGFTAIGVIADFLRLFKQYCLQEVFPDVFNVPAGGLAALHVQWCLTVPAIWRDDQKEAMRQAAYLAGMIPDPGSDQLQIILEPEAAMMHCMHDSTLLAGLPSNTMRQGSTLMIVDAGGGTVDLTVHRIQGITTIPGGQGGSQQKVAMEEVAAGMGALCGSTYVDRMFEHWFRGKLRLGDWTYAHWKQQHYGEYMQVMNKWEEEKRRFMPGKSGDVYITLPLELYGTVEDLVIDQLAADTGRDGRVYITEQQLQKFFDPLVEEIESMVCGMVSKCPGGSVDLVMLAGGFSNSKYLQHRLQQLRGITKQNRCFIIPEQPESVILKGAVLHNAGRAVITSRRLRLTYGFNRYMKTEEVPFHVPSQHKKWCNEQGCYETVVFEPIATMGEAMAVDEVKTESLTAWSATDDSFLVELYAVPAPTARFLDEKGMQKVVTLDVPVQPGGKDRVSINFKFGLQEIQITAFGGVATQRPVTIKKRYCQNSFAC